MAICGKTTRCQSWAGSIPRRLIARRARDRQDADELLADGVGINRVRIETRYFEHQAELAVAAEQVPLIHHGSYCLLNNVFTVRARAKTPGKSADPRKFTDAQDKAQ